MDIDRFKGYAPTVLRVGLSLVFLWFGLNQFFDAEMFLGYVPGWAADGSVLSIPAPAPETMVMMNGVIETILGTALLVGYFTRVAAGILAVHLLGITLTLGYNDLAIRDLGLTIALVAVFLQGPDKHTLDLRRRKA